MSYPGDQGRPGGRPAEQPPPQAPYGPGPERPAPAPRFDQTAVMPPAERPYDGAPHAPGTTRPEAPYGGDRYAGDPYAGDPYAGDPYGGDRHAGERYAADPYAGDRYRGEPDEPSGAGDRRATEVPRGRGRRRAARARPGGQSPLIIGAAIVAGTVLVAAGMGISSLLKDDSTTASSNAPTATSPTPTATGSPAKRPALGLSRTTDPVPLTLSEIFRHRTFTVGTKRYTMTVWRADRLCTRTVNGTTLMAALRRGSCSQVMRATFASSDGKLIGTVGVANLRTATAAKATTRLWNTKDAWLRPLPGPGITKKIGTGSALGTFQNKGHYLLMTWVQQPNGKAIPATQQKLVSAFGQSVMLGSGLYEALNYRGTEGKPLQS